VPLVGLFVVVAWTAGEAIKNKMVLRKVVAVAAIAVILAMGLLTARQVGYWKDDLSLFSRARSATKYNPGMLANLGVVLGERGRPEEGLSALKEAMRLLPDNDKIVTSTGDLLSRYGKFQESLEYYEKAIQLQPGNRTAQLGIATALVRVGRNQEAEVHCRKAIELDTKSGDAYNLLGIILGQMKRMDESLAAFERAAESQSGIASARLNMAMIYVGRGDMDAAIAECKKSIAMKQDHTAYDYLGGVFVKAGKLNEAELAYRDALRLGPEVAKVHYDLAVLLVLQGRRDEAIGEAEKASHLEPGNAAIREYLGKLSEK
jgi:Flp pilus assembly protein TadD